MGSAAPLPERPIPGKAETGLKNPGTPYHPLEPSKAGEVGAVRVPAPKKPQQRARDAAHPTREEVEEAERAIEERLEQIASDKVLGIQRRGRERRASDR